MNRRTVGRRGPPAPRNRGNRRKNTRRGGGSSSSNHHLIGTHVSVVQKQDQPTGRLTTGIVGEILTNADYHPRGIKVRLTDGTVGRIATASSETTTATPSFRGDDSTYAHEGTAGRVRENATLADFLPTPAPTESSSHEPATAVASQDDWQCGGCTFQNSGYLHACELCETPRVVTSAAP